MNSKEALEHIIKRDYNQIITTYPPQESYDGLTQKDMVDIITKDLEILKIIGNKCVATHENFEVIGKSKDYNQYYHVYKWFSYDLRSLLTEDEFEILKKWVDNLIIFWL